MSDSSVPTAAPPRWRQFSLKTLLLLMLLAAAFFSGWSVAYRQALEAEALARRDAETARLAEMQARDLAQAEALRSEALLAQARQTLQQASAIASSETAPVDAETEIGAVLQLQAEAWNAGQIDCFMEHYWKSDDLTFSAGGKTTRGWQNTLDGYRQRYPTIEKMGRLTFDQLKVQALGEEAALVLGRWHLARAEDELGGNFSLIVRKIDGRWLIVHDHTSRSEEP
jgi:beta-aspartyl-peptidase (threonine type)